MGVTARDVLGVPMLPPARVSTATGRGRARLRRLADRAVPPPVTILETLFGILDHRVLVTLCALDVPDALTGRTTVETLARQVGADPVRLERLLRFGAARGWLRLDRSGGVRPTAVTAFLRKDHPGGWRAWVEFAGGPEVVAAIGALAASDDADDGFAAANGRPFFDWMADHPERWQVFDRAMAAGGRMHALTLAAALDWSDANAICDVGGGTGELLSTLLDLLPGRTGTLVDLAPVVARAVRRPGLTLVAGDAFEAVPPGHDTYLLVNVVHDWSDDDAVRLLTSVGRAAGSARIVVVEADHPTVPFDRVGTSADVLMAALTNGGRERDRDAVAGLASRAGLRHTGSTRLASGDWAHVLQR